MDQRLIGLIFAAVGAIIWLRPTLPYWPTIDEAKVSKKLLKAAFRIPGAIMMIASLTTGKFGLGTAMMLAFSSLFLFFPGFLIRIFYFPTPAAKYWMARSVAVIAILTGTVLFIQGWMHPDTFLPHGWPWNFSSNR